VIEHADGPERPRRLLGRLECVEQPIDLGELLRVARAEVLTASAVCDPLQRSLVEIGGWVDYTVPEESGHSHRLGADPDRVDADTRGCGELSGLVWCHLTDIVGAVREQDPPVRPRPRVGG